MPASHRLPRSLLTVLAVLAACGGEPADEPAADAGAEAAGEIPGRTVVEGDFQTPESIVHDIQDDVYLVSNIAGAPMAEDGNGFISRVTPEGEIAELAWIDGSAEGVTLHAPKGMAIRGDTLFVADITCVRMFVRTSGDPAGEVCFPEATFLADVAVDGNDVLYVTDSGTPSNPTDAVYRFDAEGRRAKLLEGGELGGPNGIAFGDRGGFVVTFRTGEIYQIRPDGTRQTVLPANPQRQLDGIAFMPDGGFLFSSWGSGAVYQVTASGQPTPVVDRVEAPADIGYDALRNRVLVPLYTGNRLVFQELAPS